MSLQELQAATQEMAMQLNTTLSIGVIGQEVGAPGVRPPVIWST